MNDYAAKTGHRKLPKIFIIVLSFIVIVAGATGAFIYRTYQQNLLPVGGGSHSQLITIEAGSSPGQIAAELESLGLIKRAWAFEWYIRIHGLGGKLQAGTFSIRPDQPVEEIVVILTKGKEATDLVTIYPGKRLDQIRDDLINQGFDAAVVDAALSPANYQGHPALVYKPAEASLEGYLFPESFQRTATTSLDQIIRLSLDQTEAHITPEVKAGFERQGLTVHQAVILASIVEKEVGSNDPALDLEDKKKVAQVFLRRLRENHALESNATASYGAILAGAEPSQSFTSSYNTYQNRGLTPSPICNVGEHSLLAVAEPSDTDYFYFVSGDNKVNYFSHTLEEHQRLVREHCQSCP